ncbi:MAG TPA: hypothetical protein VFX59_28950, partial [Polyangiales bacterium]|nr:hypothetical protein [Polyangiales bacterium]
SCCKLVRTDKEGLLHRPFASHRHPQTVSVLARTVDPPEQTFFNGLLGAWNAGTALVTWFKDPDGNLLSMTQPVRKP